MSLMLSIFIQLSAVQGHASKSNEVDLECAYAFAAVVEFISDKDSLKLIGARSGKFDSGYVITCNSYTDQNGFFVTLRPKGYWGLPGGYTFRYVRPSLISVRYGHNSSLMVDLTNRK